MAVREAKKIVTVRLTRRTAIMIKDLVDTEG